MCNCENLYDQDCNDEDCWDRRRRVRQAVFDYMVCVQLEEQFTEE